MTGALWDEASPQLGTVVARRRDDAAHTLDLDLAGVRAAVSALDGLLSRDTLVTNARAAETVAARRRVYLSTVVLIDFAAISAAVGLGYLFRFQGGDTRTNVPYLAVGIGLGTLWALVLYWNKSYDERVLGYGAEEFRRVVSGSLKLAGGVAIAAYLVDVAIARGFLGLTFIMGTALLPAGRWLARRPLHRHRQRGGGWTRRVLVVGDTPNVVHLTSQLGRERHAGYQVVGACIPDALVAPHPQQLGGVPVVGSFNCIVEAAVFVSADTVAITSSAELSGLRLRRLGWQMEGTGIDLVVAPALTDVAGPRIHTQPVAGLPLIHVSSPECEGARKWLKGLFDRAVALAALVVLSPAFLAISLAIHLTSPGPVFFKQRRVGLGGFEFNVYKFRSMVSDAEAKLSEVTRQNDAHGLLFKVRHDPRVTKVGRFLRRYSLDELPQLLNVLRGEMSLVGPRPPLPAEVAQYSEDVARRLLVKPGMTGLWQVSGRSDLSWEESVRLDLYYVENWSLATDLAILWKTIGAVAGRRGAY